MKLSTEHTFGIIMSITFSVLMLLVISIPSSSLDAQSISEIRNRIDERTGRIQELEKEIKQYENRLGEVSGERQTLEQALAELNLSFRKTETEIEVTNERIGSVSSEIERIDDDITSAETSIENSKEAIAAAVRNLNEADDQTLVESILVYENLSRLWDRMAQIENFQIAIKNRVGDLQEIKERLSEDRERKKDQRSKLELLDDELDDRRVILEQNREEERQLLKQTQEEESEYERILADRRARRDQFLSELQSLEAELQMKIDPGRLPSEGTAVLSWPLRNSTGRSCYADGAGFDACITQYFGHTSFSKRNAAYGGNGHNGADFRAPRGTPIYAAAEGVVKGTGNTDAVPGCYSYGKWVLIEHPFGISTNYAHLSVISVSPGQSVSSGELIGYSGNTGYSTGPHLHFSTYATQGVKIVRLGDVKAITNCGAASIPVAGTNAYLNPLSYLPSN